MKKRLQILAIVWLLGAAIYATAGPSIQLQWSPSPSDSVGTNSLVSNYFLYWNTTANTNAISSVNTGLNITGTITNATPGLTYQIWVTAADTNNIESDPSNVVSFAVPDTFPSAVVLLSAKIAQTNKTWQINVNWVPAPFHENVTGYKLDVIQDGIISTNLFTTNTSAIVTTPIKKALSAVVTPTNYYGWGKSNIVWSYAPPATPQMQIIYLK